MILDGKTEAHSALGSTSCHLLSLMFNEGRPGKELYLCIVFQRHKGDICANSAVPSASVEPLLHQVALRDTSLCAGNGEATRTEEEASRAAEGSSLSIGVSGCML